MLRLARYAARLGFEIEPHTRELAEQAIADGALDTVSGERIGAELWLAARESDGRGGVARARALGVLRALGLRRRSTTQLAGTLRRCCPPTARTRSLLMACSRSSEPEEGCRPRDACAPRLHASRPRRCALAAATPGDRQGLLGRPRGCRRAWRDPVDAGGVVGRAGARGARPRTATRVREWLDTQRHVRLEIDGNDLLAAGVPEGPEVGAAPGG